MSQRAAFYPAALDLASRVVSGGRPTRSVTGDLHLLASALLAMEGALRASALADRSAPYAEGEPRSDGAVPEGTGDDATWLTPRQIAELILGPVVPQEVAHADAG